ncbi:DUF1330 domain-containing protein [Litorivita sp. NS0012-18]|uniref:DUF1330 domain-containing protein n=1 Tax=Litorivita sp. NS0012-18 TaxID=3127655 RepID=UPI003108744D
MSVYFVVEFHIVDKRRFRQFREAFAGHLIAAGGTLLATDDAPAALLGASTDTTMGIVHFDDAQAAMTFVRSEDMQQLSVLREAACSDTRVVMIKGFSGPLPPATPL